MSCICLKCFLGVQEKSAVEAPTSADLYVSRLMLICRWHEVSSAAKVRQGVGFLKVTKLAATAETSTKGAKHISQIFLSSAQTTIHTQTEILPQQHHALQTHSLKQSVKRWKHGWYVGYILLTITKSCWYNDYTKKRVFFSPHLTSVRLKIHTSTPSLLKVT